MKRIIVWCVTIIALQVDAKTFLVFGGKTGWIGQSIMQSVKDQGHLAVAACARLENRAAIEQEIQEVKPDYIINSAGVIGRPNVDWCEDHRPEVIRTNLVGALNLADLAQQHNIHLTIIGTGCIYNYDDAHPMYSGIGFTEEETPNFDNAFYCKTKIFLEEMLREYPQVLYLRLRLPVAGDFYERNLIHKLTRYEKVVNIPNSLTVLDELVPLVPAMALRGSTGVYNFVNPGVISHNEMLDLYKTYINPSFQYQNFSLEEQAKILKAGRCYNELNVTKLLKEFPYIKHVKEAMVELFKKMKAIKMERNNEK